MTFDWNPQIEIATNIDIKIVNRMKRGNAYFLNTSVQQEITRLNAMSPTDTKIITAVLIKMFLKVSLL